MLTELFNLLSIHNRQVSSEDPMATGTEHSRDLPTGADRVVHLDARTTSGYGILSAFLTVWNPACLFPGCSSSHSVFPPCLNLKYFNLFRSFPQKLRPSVRRVLTGSPFKAWGRSEYSHACFIHCQEKVTCSD